MKILMALGVVLVALWSFAAMAAEQRCYVGVNTQSNAWSIACDQTYGTGSQVLTQQGYRNIVFGPRIWDECKQWADKNLGKTR